MDACCWWYRLRQTCEITQCFLEAGADSNVFVLLRVGISTHRPTHAISLKTLIRQLDPPNRRELLELMEEPTPSQGIVGVLGATWKYLTTAKPSATVTTAFHFEDYIPFDIAMEPTIMNEDGKHEDALFYVCAVQVGGTRVDPDVLIRCN